MKYIIILALVLIGCKKENSEDRTLSVYLFDYNGSYSYDYCDKSTGKCYKTTGTIKQGVVREFYLMNNRSHYIQINSNATTRCIAELDKRQVYDNTSRKHEFRY